MKLMIGDDSGIMRKAIEKYLTGTGIEIVGTAGDGKQAVEMFKQTLPMLLHSISPCPKWTACNALKNC